MSSKAKQPWPVVPGELTRAFWQFKQDFAQVSAQWVARAEESEESVEVARDGLCRYLADAAGAEGVARLRAVFACWREMAQRVCPHGVGVVPVLSFEAERRIADRKWAKERQA